MRLSRDTVICLMKCIVLFFLVFMSCKSLRVLSLLVSEDLSEYSTKHISSVYDEDFCNRYWMFHIFAFVLGAFWNVKKMIKVGIL